VVSALAEGADRLVVNEVLKWPGSKLLCVLPVAEDDLDVYLADFESEHSRAEFRRLYQRAWRHICPRPGLVLGLVPRDATRAQREDGYLWAGRAVIRNSDILVAIWDGEHSRGVGGTADMIRRMRERDERSAALAPAFRVHSRGLMRPPLQLWRLAGATGCLRLRG